jgi:uncharacterized membrane-anchored protein
MNKKKLIYCAIVAAQILLLAFMVVRQENLLASGTKVLLKCKPVDPRSLFSGDYVVLNYDISDITGLNAENVSNGETIYVALKKDFTGKYHVFADCSADLNALKKTYSVVIRGTKENLWMGGNAIRYGIEQYFVPQNQGRNIESDLRDVSVLVSIDDKGNSAVSKLYINDREVTFY